MITLPWLGWRLRSACNGLARNPDTQPDHLFRLADAFAELRCLLFAAPDDAEAAAQLDQVAAELRRKAALRR
jgi:hypothetical protein